MLVNKKIIYPKLSYKINGCLFEVYKELGPGHREKLYQQALKKEFENNRIGFKSQIPIEIRYKQNPIGKYYLDFLIENKIILEIKVGSYFLKRNLEQILDYLKSSNLKLGIIANFTRDGVKFYRVINLK